MERTRRLYGQHGGQHRRVDVESLAGSQSARGPSRTEQALQACSAARTAEELRAAIEGAGKVRSSPALARELDLAYSRLAEEMSKRLDPDPGRGGGIFSLAFAWYAHVEVTTCLCGSVPRKIGYNRQFITSIAVPLPAHHQLTFGTLQSGCV